MIDAVLVPPSALITSQSIHTVRSPSASMSVTARSDLPMSRWISWVLPEGRPFSTSRRTLSVVDRGSIEYSAVTQPFPRPCIQRGTEPSTDAVQMTLVSPISTRHEPSAYGM